MQTLEEVNILLVDDSRELLTILTDALHGAGFAHVACAQSVREALTFTPVSTLEQVLRIVFEETHAEAK